MIFLQIYLLNLVPNLILQLIFVSIVPIKCMEVALFASSGCYSHDSMMVETGMEFEGHNITWMQAKIYRFDANPIKLPSKWQKLILEKTDENGNGSFYVLIQKALVIFLGSCLYGSFCYSLLFICAKTVKI